MPVIVVTRLRVRDHADDDEFFTAAVALLEQAKRSEGLLGADVLADADDTWWTATGWQARHSMNAFVSTDPHRSTMARLDDWCDEATFVDWDQDSADLPDWQTSFRRMVADGQVAALTHASAANATRAFPRPSNPAPSDSRPARTRRRSRGKTCLAWSPRALPGSSPGRRERR